MTLLRVGLACALLACKSEPPAPAPKISPVGSAAPVAPVTGTSPEQRAVLDKHAPMVTAKWANVNAIAAEILAAPRLTTAAPVATPISDRLVVPERRMRTPGNTLFASLERVADPNTEMTFGFHTQPLLKIYNDLVAPTSDTRMPPQAIEGELSKLADVKYALIIRSHAVRQSKLVPAKLGPRYEPGGVTGEAFLYDLDTKQRLGGFPFTYNAPADYVIKPNETDDQLVRRLDDHLRTTVQLQLVNAMSAFATKAAR
jgi:hypothetical protein